METIDLGRAIRAPFQDKDWIVKTLLALVWQLLIVTAPAISGAQVVYLKRVSEGDERIPDWSDFGGLWVKGILSWLAGFIYFLPVIAITAVFIVPASVATVVGDSGSSVGSALLGAGCIWIILITVYAFAVSLLFYAALTNYAIKGEFGAFFQFGEILARVRAGNGYFLAWLLAWVVGIVGSTAVSFLSGITGGFGAILSPAVTYLVALIAAHLFGQWAMRSSGTDFAPAMVPAAVPTPPAPYAPPAAPYAPTAQAPAPAAPPAAPPVSPAAAPPVSPAQETPPVTAPNAPAPETPPAPPEASE